MLSKERDIMYTALKNEMTAYYRKMDMRPWMTFADAAVEEKFRAEYERIFAEMDAFYAENPSTPTPLLKSKLHSLMAEYCEPIIFKETPFFFELFYNHSRSRGLNKNTPACWLVQRKNAELERLHPEYAEMTARYLPYFDRETNNVCSHYDTFDHDHNTLDYTELLKVGIGGIRAEAQQRLSELQEGSAEHNFCRAVVESCDAVITIAHKFADKAETLLGGDLTDTQRENLALIAKTARKIPENAPETFYEGLAMLLFIREVTPTLENVAISQFGHVDRLLIGLYERDVAAGRITETDARRLITQFMLHTDVKFDVENNKWPESSACIQLGGCDEDGEHIFNDLTRMFIEEHHREKLLNPKLNCRYSASSPEEYLKLIGKALIRGHNNFALFNDDIVIPSLVDSGVAIEDARKYVNGGCQEMMLEGFGHTEGTAFYISLLRFFDVFLSGDDTADIIEPIANADTFEELYSEFIASFKRFYDEIIDQRNFRQSFYKKATSTPLFSAMQSGCIKSGRDYTDGGAKYNFATVALAGFANLVDSLYSIKSLVYDDERISLDGFRAILEKNWKGHEEFRREVVRLPKYAQNDGAVDALANRLFSDIATIIKSRKNERGGIYLPSVFVYSFNRTFAPCLRATPDGRYDFDYLGNGCGPSFVKPLSDLTAPINSMKNVDFGVCGGAVAVLDVMLPASASFDEDNFAAFMRAVAMSGCVTLQPNVLSKDELIDAKAHPERHPNLFVRVCGLSVYFTALAPDVQDEIISRNFYN